MTINVVTYTVEGHTLVIKETGGEETESTFVGTWSGQVGMNTINLVLNEDGTGTYNDIPIIYKVDRKSIECVDEGENFALHITYDSSEQNLTVQYEDLTEGYTYDGTLTDYSPFEDEGTDEEDAAYVGTWTAKMVLNDVTIVINADRTVKYGDMTFSYTASGNVLTCVEDTEYFTLTITYNEEGDTIHVEYENYGYNMFSGDGVRA